MVDEGWIEISVDAAHCGKNCEYGDAIGPEFEPFCPSPDWFRVGDDDNPSVIVDDDEGGGDGERWGCWRVGWGGLDVAGPFAPALTGYRRYFVMPAPEVRINEPWRVRVEKVEEALRMGVDADGIVW